MEYTGIKDIDNIIENYKYELEKHIRHKKILVELKDYNYTKYDWCSPPIEYMLNYDQTGFLSIVSNEEYITTIHQGVYNFCNYYNVLEHTINYSASEDEYILDMGLEYNELDNTDVIMPPF